MREFTESETKAWLATLEKRMSSSHVVLYTKSGEFLVVKNNYLRFWSLPGGVVDPGETPRAAAVREVEEEVGITLNEYDLEFCLVVDRISNLAHRYQFIFQAKVDAAVFNAITLAASEIEDCGVVTRERIFDDDHEYAQVIHQWADGVRGYIEEIYAVRASDDTVITDSDA